MLATLDQVSVLLALVDKPRVRRGPACAVPAHARSFHIRSHLEQIAIAPILGGACVPLTSLYLSSLKQDLDKVKESSV